MDSKCRCGCDANPNYKFLPFLQGKPGLYYVVDMIHPEKGTGTTYNTFPAFSEPIAVDNKPSSRKPTAPVSAQNPSMGNAPVPPAMPNANVSTTPAENIPPPPIWPNANLAQANAANIPDPSIIPNLVPNSNSPITVSTVPMTKVSPIFPTDESTPTLVTVNAIESIETAKPAPAQGGSDLASMISGAFKDGKPKLKPVGSSGGKPPIANKPDVAAILLRRQKAFLGRDDTVEDENESEWGD